MNGQLQTNLLKDAVLFTRVIVAQSKKEAENQP